jgi:hypothetical protein
VEEVLTEVLMLLGSIDWPKLAAASQALLTPVLGIATIALGIATFKIQQRQAQTQRQVAEIQRQQAEIQRQQAVTQQQQAETSNRTFRLSLFEQRMAVFNALTKFLADIDQTANVTLPETFAMLRETRDHEFLFGPEVKEFIETAYKMGVDLSQRRELPQQERNPNEEKKLLEWFASQLREAKTIFLPYIDFTEQ